MNSATGAMPAISAGRESDLAQRLRDPDHAGQADEEDDRRPGGDLQDIAIQQSKTHASRP
jgi:hypothetical protein